MNLLRWLVPVLLFALGASTMAQIFDWAAPSPADTTPVIMKLDAEGRAVTLENLATTPFSRCRLVDYEANGAVRSEFIVTASANVVARDMVIDADGRVAILTEENGEIRVSIVNAARTSTSTFNSGTSGIAGSILDVGGGNFAISSLLVSGREAISIFNGNNGTFPVLIQLNPISSFHTPKLALDDAGDTLVFVGLTTLGTMDSPFTNPNVISLTFPMDTVKVDVVGNEIWAIGKDTTLDGGDWRVVSHNLTTLGLSQSTRVRGAGNSVDVPRDMLINGSSITVVGDSGPNGMRAVLDSLGVIQKVIDPNLSWRSISATDYGSVLSGVSTIGSSTAWVLSPFAGAAEQFRYPIPAPGGREAFDLTNGVVDPSGSVILFGAALNGDGNPAGVIERTILAQVTGFFQVSPGSGAGVTISLTGPAPRDLTFSFEASNGAVAPATVTVPSGESLAGPLLTYPSPPSDTVVSYKINGISAAWNSSTIVRKLGVASVALNPTSIFSGGSIFGAVTLNGPAPVGGTNVILQDSSGLATTPASVFVPAGQTTAGFNITTFVSRLDQTITVSAFLNGTTASSTFDLKRSTLQGVEIGPVSVIGGTPANAVVKVNGLAAESNIIALTSSNIAAATVPSQVVVVKGQSQASFVVTTKGIAADATVTITGTMNSVSQTDTLLVKAAKLVTLSLPATVPGGSSATGTLATDGIMPPGGAANTVTLSDNSAQLTTPASAVFPFLSTSTTFTVTAAAVATNTNVTVSAVFRGLTKTATITILRPVIQSIDLSADAVVSGTPVTVTVRLSATAPAGGAAVTIQSSNSALFPVPASVFVPAGSRSISFVRTSGATATTQTVTITAVRFGTASKVLTVVP